MGIREKVKKGQLSSEDALIQAQSFVDDAPELRGWLKRRIARGADAEEQAAREKAAEQAKAAKKAAAQSRKPRQRRRK
jgi:hypothetical protein